LSFVKKVFPFWLNVQYGGFGCNHAHATFTSNKKSFETAETLPETIESETIAVL